MDTVHAASAKIHHLDARSRSGAAAGGGERWRRHAHERRAARRRRRGGQQRGQRPQEAARKKGGKKKGGRRVPKRRHAEEEEAATIMALRGTEADGSPLTAEGEEEFLGEPSGDEMKADGGSERWGSPELRG